MLFTACANAEAGDSFSLSGADWKIHEDPQSQGVGQQYFNADLTGAGWIPAQVPGNIQADVEAAHLLPPLWYGAINPQLYDVARKDWWYRKDFLAPAACAGKRLTLVFDGVDERCQVWLNGSKLGANAGMFRRFSFDVSALVQPGQTNRLAVQLARMPEELLPYLINADGPDVPNTPYWFLNGINKTRQVLKELKTPGNFSYDWSTDVWTLGIWKNVRIECTGPARIEWTRVQTALSRDFTSATVTATLEIDSLVEGRAQATFRIDGPSRTSPQTVEAVLKKGRNLLAAKLPLVHPALWWPSGQGAQPLYTLQAELRSADGSLSDTRPTRFGIRDLAWVYTQDAPTNWVNRYQLVINGRKVRALGSGLILPYVLPGCGLEHELQLLHRAKAAGMNYLRINGGGGGALFDGPWYDLADELGIMISHEFPLGNCDPETDPEFLGHLETTVRGMFKEYRNHPSIIEFVGGNEMGWDSTTRHPALQLMQKLAAEETDQLFRATCPDAGAKHAPWDFNILSSYRHYNTVDSVLSGDFGLLPSTGNTAVDTMRYGEFGTSSPANEEVWHRDIPPASQWPLDNTNDPVLIHKNTLNAVFTPYHWLCKPQIDWAFGQTENLHDTILAGQYLGADPLRYIFDELRRRGKRLGGLSNHCFSEPWPNGAGSYMVDFDGRTLMNYDFVRQALAPISLSLRYDSVLYSADAGVQVVLFLVSDAPKAAEGLHAKWVARDREGIVFDQGSIISSIAPLEVKSLGTLRLRPPQQTSEGPVFVELRLEDSKGKFLTERVQVFGQADLPGPFAGLLKHHAHSTPQEASDGPSNGPDNLAFVGNGAKPATASSALPNPKHQPQGLNDGKYGNDHSWIGLEPRSWFQIDLGKVATIGQFKLGRDRTASMSDRQVDYLKIETSPDGMAWRPVFEQSGLTALKGYSPSKSLLVSVPPMEARFVKVTVDSPKAAQGEMACVDEFEVYAPAKESVIGQPQVRFIGARSKVYAVRRTALQVTATSVHRDTDQEVLDLQVKNTGRMTALFCEPHPLLVYRTDLFIDNNNCFIPPGESRVITIRASSRAKCGLSLAQTGWTVSTWNADEVTVAPSAEVMLSVGRWDKLCREYAGYFDVNQVKDSAETHCSGPRDNAGKLPYRMWGSRVARFDFECNGAQAKHSARLRIHTSDQAETSPTVVEITVNGRTMEKTLGPGLGIQRTDPAHLAFPETMECQLSGSDLRKGKNTLSVRVKGTGWFSWDALDLVSKP